MKNLGFFVFILSLTTSCASQAIVHAPADSSEVMFLFSEINKFYRKSGEEKAVRDFIEQYITSHAPGSTARTDKAGNLLIKVLGTHSAQNAAPISLQAHMDMVLDLSPQALEKTKTSAFPKGDVDGYFKNGVGVIYENGIGHSLNYESTIGADNGIGIAMLMIISTNLNRAHPPLELLFTVSEEQGLVGAKNLELPITAKKMINVDSFDYGMVTNGCMGSKRVVANFSHPESTILLPEEWSSVTVNLDGLRGGHSGEDIYKNRFNSVLITLELLHSLLAIPDTYIASVSAGELDKLNKIPSKSEFQAVFKKKNEALVHKNIRSFRESLLNRAAKSKQLSHEEIGEDESKIRLEEKYADWDGSSTNLVAESAALKSLIQSIQSIPTGVVAHNKKMAHEIETSSNLGGLKISSGAKSMEVTVGWMPRSFKNEALEGYIKNVESKLATFAKPEDIKIPSQSPAWEPQASSKLLKSFRAHTKKIEGKRFGVESTLGGLETTWFVQKFPGIDIISIGPNIRDAHSTKESIDVASVHRLYDVLTTYLEEQR